MACRPTVTVARPAISQSRGRCRRTPMSGQTGLSRRAMLAKLGMLFNAAVGVILAIPIVGYILSPVARARKAGYEAWLSLGGIEQFPAGQTRLAIYRNPIVDPWDGQTAD